MEPPIHRCIVLFFTNRLQTREEGKALLRQILQLRNQGETLSTDIAAPVFLPASLSATNTPTRRVSPLNLSSVTPWTMLVLLTCALNMTLQTGLGTTSLYFQWNFYIRMKGRSYWKPQLKMYVPQQAECGLWESAYAEMWEHAALLTKLFQSEGRHVSVHRIAPNWGIAKSLSAWVKIYLKFDSALLPLVFTELPWMTS